MANLNDANKVMLEVKIPFSGWYHSLADGMLDIVIEHTLFGVDDEELRDEIFDNIDFGAVREKVNKDYVEQYLFDNGLKGVFSGSTSPKYYNYETDKVYASVTLESLFELKKQATEGDKFLMESFDLYVKNHYTSRSGFISFIDTDTKKYTFKDGKEWGLFLEFLEHEKSNEYCILETLFSSGSFSLEFKDGELDNKHYELLEEFA